MRKLDHGAKGTISPKQFTCRYCFFNEAIVCVLIEPAFGVDMLPLMLRHPVNEEIIPSNFCRSFTLFVKRFTTMYELNLTATNCQDKSMITLFSRELYLCKSRVCIYASDNNGGLLSEVFRI
jgi:hypothetical protein